jgi:hypothetical protein
MNMPFLTRTGGKTRLGIRTEMKGHWEGIRTKFYRKETYRMSQNKSVHSYV